jgi:hypothetical protein
MERSALPEGAADLKGAALTTLGSIFLFTGAAYMSVHLCQPSTFLGSINFIAVGLYFVLTNSKEFRKLVFLAVPARVRSVVYERWVARISQCTLSRISHITFFDLSHAHIQVYYGEFPRPLPVRAVVRVRRSLRMSAS